MNAPAAVAAEKPSAAERAVGQRFGRLTVVGVEKSGRKARVLASCACGSGTKSYRLDGLKSGATASCGCLKKETDRQEKPSRHVAFADLLHKRFGRLLATGVHRETGKPTRIVCRCDCGAQALVIPTKLRNGETTSCGCFHHERLVEQGKATIEHGHSRHGPLASGHTSIYRAWLKIRQLCRDAERRGAVKCSAEYDPAWETFDGFYADWGDIGFAETVMRKDRGRPWCKENCFVGQGPMDSRRKTREQNAQASGSTSSSA